MGRRLRRSRWWWLAGWCCWSGQRRLRIEVSRPSRKTKTRRGWGTQIFGLSAKDETINGGIAHHRSDGGGEGAAARSVSCRRTGEREPLARATAHGARRRAGERPAREGFAEAARRRAD